MTDSLVVSDAKGVRTLRLNRPKRLNALDAELRMALVAALDQAAEDEDVRAVLMTGTGERGFCAGQDLNESSALNADDAARWMATWDDFFRRFLTFPKPIVAAVNGVAAGAGLDLVLFSDVRVATPEARFIMAEINVGLPTLFGSFLLMQEVFWSRAQKIVLTGETITAPDAQTIGMIHDIVAPDALATHAAVRAAELAAKPPIAMRLTVERFRSMRLAAMNTHGVFDAMKRYQAEAIASGEPQQIMAAFLARKTDR